MFWRDFQEGQKISCVIKNIFILYDLSLCIFSPGLWNSNSIASFVALLTYEGMVPPQSEGISVNPMDNHKIKEFPYRTRC